MNLDFIFIVQSGLLFMLAIAAAGLARLEPDRPWRFISLFGAALTLHAWANVVAADFGDVTPLRIVKLGFLLAAILALSEFALHHHDEARHGRLRRLGSLPLLAVAALAAWGWREAGATWTLLALGIAASLWAASSLFRYGAVETAAPAARRLRLIAWLLPIHVVTTMLPGNPWTGAAFALPGVPNHIIPALVATLFSLAVYTHNAALQQAILPPPAARSWRVRRLLCIAGVWLVVFAGWIMADLAGHDRDAEMRQQVLVRTRLAAAAIDPQLVGDLHWDESDLANPSYQRLKAVMISLHRANSDLRFAMLTGLRHGRAYFLADSEPPTSPDYSPPGQAYDEAEADYLAGLARHEAFVLGPVEDRWGVWISGSAPVLQLADGRSVTLDLDVAASGWAGEVRRARLPVALITLLISVLIIGFFQAQERLRESALLTLLSEQRMRVARDAAETATRAKSEFLAVMSHELRTPLAGVIGMLDLLRRSPPEPSRRQYTAVARDSAGTLLRILDDILDMAKIEAGRLTLESIPFRPRDTFPHLCEAARLRAATNGIGFSYTTHHGVPEVLIGDPTRLRQVLGNLQNNALKFTAHGEVNVEVDCRPLDAGHVQLVIAVRDTGCGIAEEHRARLFAKFEQADLSTTRRYGGTGLGLSIVKALAESMHGEVSVQSTVGRGSTFTFAVPLTVGAADSVPPAEEDHLADLPPAAASLRILCAEDDAVNRLVAEALITRLGHHIEFAENGEQTLARLRIERFDLVLMDGRMPVMDGFQTTRLIRSGTAGVLDKDVYVCAATANVSEADKIECQNAGMNDYVKKPLAERELFDAFDRAIAWHAVRGRTPLLSQNAATPTYRAPGLSEAELLASLDADEPPSAPSAVEAAGFSTETLGRLQSLFWEQAPAQVSSLRLALERRDAHELGELAHALKSSSFYIGATQLSRLFADLERLANEEAMEASGTVLSEAEAEFARLRPPVAQSVPT